MRDGRAGREEKMERGKEGLKRETREKIREREKRKILQRAPP